MAGLELTALCTPPLGPSYCGSHSLCTFRRFPAAPKAARDEYDRFIRAVAAAVEGEHSSGDLRALCGVVWRQLAALPPPDTSRGRGMQQALRPHRWGPPGW